MTNSTWRLGAVAGLNMLAAALAAGQCDTLRWTQLPSPPPALTPRAAGVGVFDLSAPGRFGVVQGFTTENTRETWMFSSGQWSLASTAGPSARRGHGVAYDTLRGRTLLFGGFDGTYRNDLWSWDGSTWTLITPSNSPPAARDNMAIAYDSARDRLVVFGGTKPSSLFDDTWEYDPTANRWLEQFPPHRPTRRGYLSAAYDPVSARTVIFGGGGDTNGQQLRDTWVWDGTDWDNFGNGLPGPRRLHTLVYNGARGRVTLIGGYRDAAPSIYYNDVWEWNGDAWIEVTPAGPAPSPRSAPYVAFDPLAARVLLFGGSTPAGNVSDFWTLTGPPLLKDQTRRMFICPDTIAAFSVSPAGTGTFTFAWQFEAAPGQWTNLSDGMVDGVGVVTGASDALLQIAPLGDGQRFRCIVTAVSGACGTVTSDPVALRIKTKDLNQDGNADQDDIRYLIGVIAGAPNYTDIDSDINNDGSADQADIDAMVDWISGGNCP